MGKNFTLSIICPGKLPLKKEAISLQAPSWNGHIGIKHGRQPLVATMEAGVISITDENGKKSYIATTGGFIEVQGNVVTLLCDSIITPEDLSGNSFKNIKSKFYTKDYSKLREPEKEEYLMDMLRYKLTFVV